MRKKRKHLTVYRVMEGKYLLSFLQGAGMLMIGYLCGSLHSKLFEVSGRTLFPPILNNISLKIISDGTKGS